MVIGLLGSKIGMTQIFDKSGNTIPVTILKVGPCVITQIKTKSKDGYNSVQIGYGSTSKKALNQLLILIDIINGSLFLKQFYLYD